MIPLFLAPLLSATLQGAGENAGSAAMLSRLPLAFVENRGQWDTPARFVARRGGMTARVEKDALVLQLERREEDDRIDGIVVRLVFEGALETVALEGEGTQPGIWNFFLGNDPAKWRTEVPGYASVLYRGLREGVDLRVREEGGRLEYDLILSPGADLDGVVVRCEGIEGLEVEPDGSPAMRTPLGRILQSPPATWQVLPGGERMPIEARFRVIGPERFGFEAPARDPAHALIIDPGLVYATFLGGTLVDSPTALALDASGAATVAGLTLSPGFPTTAGAYDTSFNPIWTSSDVFVSRLSPDGGTLLYSTFLGGVNSEAAGALALDPSGAATLAGRTWSEDFPTTAGAYDTSFNVGASWPDAFVTRLSPTGAFLLYSTFLGGTDYDQAYALALDASGAATVAGTTTSVDFPTTVGAYDTSWNAGFVKGSPLPDAFVTRLSPSGGSLLFSTYLGGAGGDIPSAVAVDPSGATTVAGETSSQGGFPVTLGAFDTTFNGGITDAFVFRLSPSGGALLYSTFLGGTSREEAYALAVDPSGAATVAGGTESFLGFPTTLGAFDTTLNGGYDVFVSRLSASGGSLLYSTFLGGGSNESARALALDASGATTLVGGTGSVNFPTTAGAFDTTFNGGLLQSDAILARLSPSGESLLYSTYLSGDSAVAFALHSTGAATVAAVTWTSSVPTTAGAFDTTFNGAVDAFVARLDLLPAGVSEYGASTPGCAGSLAIGVTSWPQVGNPSFTITCTNAPPNAVGRLGVSLAAASPLFFVAGVLVGVDPFTTLFLDTSSNAIGAAEVPIPIPSSPALAGGQSFAQFFWLGPSAPSPPCPPLGISASNALALVVQP